MGFNATADQIVVKNIMAAMIVAAEAAAKASLKIAAATARNEDDLLIDMHSGEFGEPENRIADMIQAAASGPIADAFSKLHASIIGWQPDHGNWVKD